MTLTQPQRQLLLDLYKNPRHVWENYAPLKVLLREKLVQPAEHGFGFYTLTLAGKLLAAQIEKEMRS